MKLALVTVLLAASAFAQTPSAVSTAACGPEQVDFYVKRDASVHTLAQPQPGKAQVYFFHDAGVAGTLAYPTMKLGMDGAWVGANHGNSYFSVSVDPGEHHLCASVQSSLVGQRVELSHFTAEAGKVYYYRTRLFMAQNIALLELDSIDSDQAMYLIRSYPLSISGPKK